jgi:hypothetical protein
MVIKIIECLYFALLGIIIYLTLNKVVSYKSRYLQFFIVLILVVIVSYLVDYPLFEIEADDFKELIFLNLFVVFLHFAGEIAIRELYNKMDDKSKIRYKKYGLPMHVFMFHIIPYFLTFYIQFRIIFN